MPRNLGPRLLLLVIAVCLLALAGCGSKSAIIKGKIVLPSNLKLIDTDQGKIVLVPEAKDIAASPATISGSDNSFVVNGLSNKGVPFGKYKITVRLQPYPGDPASEKRAQMFARINDQYSVENSKLTYDVTGDASLTIDLVKGTVTKN